MLPLIQLYSVLCIIVGDHRSPVNVCKVCVCMVDATIVTVHVSLLEEPDGQFLLRMTAMSGP